MTLERINELTPREAILVYCTAMTAWIVFFARTETALPAVAGACCSCWCRSSCISASATSSTTGRRSTSRRVPVVVAAIAGGLPSALWATVVLLTAFPGIPLVAAGIYLRSWLARKDPAYVDPWLI